MKLKNMNREGVCLTAGEQMVESLNKKTPLDSTKLDPKRLEGLANVFDNKFYTVYCRPCYIKDYQYIRSHFPKVVDILFIAWLELPIFTHFCAFAPLLTDGDILVVCKRRNVICTKGDAQKLLGETDKWGRGDLHYFLTLARGEEFFNLV